MNIDQSMQDFKDKIILLDAVSQADQQLTQLLDELQTADEKVKKAKARKQAKKERNKQRKVAKRQGTTIEVLQQL